MSVSVMRGAASSVDVATGAVTMFRLLVFTSGCSRNESVIRLADPLSERARSSSAALTRIAKLGRASHLSSHDTHVGEMPVRRAPSLDPAAPVPTDPRHGKDIAAAWMKGRITNSLLRSRSAP